MRRRSLLDRIREWAEKLDAFVDSLLPAPAPVPVPVKKRGKKPRGQR